MIHDDREGTSPDSGLVSLYNENGGHTIEYGRLYHYNLLSEITVSPK